LGKIAESTRFLTAVRGIEPSRTDDAAVENLAASVSEGAGSLESTLQGLIEASVYDPNALRLRALLSGASPQAIQAFLMGVGLRRSEFRDMVQGLKRLPSAPQRSSGKDRANYLSAARARYEQSTAALRSVCDRDLGGIE
jgi:hypothetical protein